MKFVDYDDDDDDDGYGVEVYVFAVDKTETKRLNIGYCLFSCSRKLRNSVPHVINRKIIVNES